MTYVALEPFDHNRSYRRGDLIDESLSDLTIKRLQQRGLIGPKVNPTSATGTMSSALPVAPASTEQTLKPSKRGNKRAQAEASLSPTTHTD